MGSSLGAAGTQHLAESGLSASSELIFAPLPHAILYFIKCSHLPMQVFIRPVNIATGFSWHRFCLFFVLYRRPILCTAPFIVHLPWRQQLAVKYISQASHANRAFSLTDLRWLSVSKIPCRGPWTSWPDQEESVMRCALGEATPWLWRKQIQESSCNLFIERSKGNLSWSSK